MPFTTALSGLNAATNNLAVTGNNIANANTAGFKRSRSEFADVFAAGVGTRSPGAGVRVANVAQQFSQGNMQFTENNLDLAISGEGFFTLSDNPASLESRVYSRAGEFKVDDEGNVVNNQGQALLVYRSNGPTVQEGFSQGVLEKLQLNAQNSQGLPVATKNITMQVNLDARNTQDLTTPPPPTTYKFDPTDTGSYTRQTSTSVFDSLGESHIITSYFVAGPTNPADPIAGTPETRDWYVYNYVNANGVLTPVPVDASDPGIVDDNPQDGTLAGTLRGSTLRFNSQGQLVEPVNGQVQLGSYDTNTSADDITIRMDYSNSTHIATAFSVDALTQNGLPAGSLTNIDIDSDGVVFARFSNGQATPLGKVALTRFVNPQGLVKIGDTSWQESVQSGSPIPGEGGVNNFGVIQSGAIEGSNVDLATQLVNLIVAQQAYQANAETISTEDSTIQSILNIR